VPAFNVGANLRAFAARLIGRVRQNLGGAP
jgi:hypothetical protein